MPNAKEVTLLVDGVTTRYVKGEHRWRLVEGFGCGTGYRLTDPEWLAEVAGRAKLDRIAADAQTITDLTTELESAHEEIEKLQAKMETTSTFWPGDDDHA